MTRIIMVRHGQSEANVAHLFAAHTDVELTELGKRQADAVADYLAAHERIDAVYASDLCRAMNTVCPTAARFGLTVTPVRELREIGAGLWENEPYQLLREKYADDYAVWKSTPALACPTGGERVADLYTRVTTAVLKLAAENEGKTILIGSHWTPVLAVIAHALTKSVAGMTVENTPLNAAIHIFEVENGVLTPIELNITAHLTDLPPAPPYKA